MSLNPLKLPKNHFSSSIFGGGTLLSYDSSHMGVSKFKPLWRSHFAQLGKAQSQLVFHF